MKHISHIRTENNRKLCRMPKSFRHFEYRFTKTDFMEMSGHLKLCRYCAKRLDFKDSFGVLDYYLKMLTSTHVINIGPQK